MQHETLKEYPRRLKNAESELGNVAQPHLLSVSSAVTTTYNRYMYTISQLVLGNLSKFIRKLKIKLNSYDIIIIKLL